MSSTPSKGDKVRVVIEGEYSHKGNNVNNNKAGWHIINVGSVWPGDPHQVAVPPDANIEVKKKYRPPEPQGDVMAHDTRYNRMWQKNTRILGDNCCWVNVGGLYWTWRQILDVTNNGADLALYRKVE